MSKKTAEILFRVLPVPQEQLTKLHKRGRLKEKVEQLVPLLRRSYARVFHSDSEKNDRHLLDEILKEINSGLDNLKSIDEISYSSLVKDIQNYELGISMSPETQRELEETTNALEELVVRMEDMQSSYRDFIEMYVNYLEGLADRDFKGMTYNEKCKAQIALRKCIREYRLHNLGG